LFMIPIQKMEGSSGCGESSPEERISSVSVKSPGGGRCGGGVEGLPGDVSNMRIGSIWGPKKKRDKREKGREKSACQKKISDEGV